MSWSETNFWVLLKNNSDVILYKSWSEANVKAEMAESVVENRWRN